MLKHIYPLLIFLSFTINLFAQEASISTKFSQDGNLYQTESKTSETISEFKENQKCIVTNYLGNYTYKIKYKDLVGFVKDQYLFVNEQMMDLYFDHEEEQRDKAIAERKEKEKKEKSIANNALKDQELIEQKSRDSIAKIENEVKRKLLEIQRNDSILKAKEEQRVQSIAKAKEDSIAKVNEEQNRLLAEKRINDSIATVREEARKQLAIQKRNDSIAKAEALKSQGIEQIKKDSIAQVTKEQNRILAEQRKKDFIAEAEAQKQLALQKRKDSIAKAEEEIKRQHLEQVKKDSIAQATKEQNKILAEQRKKDSIKSVKEEEKRALELLRKRNDAVVKAKAEEKTLAERKKNDSISKIKEEQKNILERLRKRNDSVVKVREQEKVLAETKRRESILKAEEEQKIALELLRKRNEAFAKSEDQKNKESKQRQEKVISQTKEAQNKDFIQRRQYDSILKVREQERKQLDDLRRQNDSIAIIIQQERRALEKLRNDNSIAQENNSSNANLKAEENKRLELLERIKFRDSCHYQINEFDRFYNITTIRTESYSISNNLTVELYRQGRKTNVFFNYTGDLGCASYLPNQRSSVKVTLENNQTIAFYHSWDIECGTFLFKAKLSSAQMNILKKSPIKSLTLKGTEDSKEINFIDYKEFFIDKLKCIE